MKKNSNFKKAFSLLELSIVLIVISLLVSGVFVGRAMLEGAMIRKAMAEMKDYQIAINSFTNIFKALPGDFTDISRYYDTACNSDPNNCNGDGDNIIEPFTESLLAWHHLQLAGVTSGQFSGKGPSDADTNTHVAGTNVPKSAVLNGQYAILHYKWQQFPDEHMIVLGAYRLNSIGEAPVLNPDDALNMDQKMDDGHPGYGKLYGRHGWVSDWTSASCLVDSSDVRVANSETKEATTLYNTNTGVVTPECIVGLVIDNNLVNNDTISASN